MPVTTGPSAPSGEITLQFNSLTGPVDVQLPNVPQVLKETIADLEITGRGQTQGWSFDKASSG